MRNAWRWGAMALGLVAAVGCNDQGDVTPMDGGTADTGTPDGGSVNTDCNPVDPSLCALPFPSSYYLDEDATTDSGYRVHFGPTSLPVHKYLGPVDPTYFNEKDGFSILDPMIFYFADVSLDGTVPVDDIGKYMDPDVKTVIVNAETGEPLPHWVEIDATAKGSERTPVFIRPAVPMEFGTRYVVGVRGLTDTSGAPIQPSEAFAALRDDTPTSDSRVEGQRDHYDNDIFPVLSTAGFDRSELQLAFDFVTKSKKSTIGQALAARDDALTQWGTDGPSYTIRADSLQDYDCSTGGDSGIGREFIVDMTVPLYTENPDPGMSDDAPGVILTRDADGLPVQNGTTTTDFIVRIPCSLIDSPQPAPLLQYGHGLFGGYGEATTGWLSHFADDHGYVVFAADWKGMEGEDELGALTMINTHPGRFNQIPERSVQGFVEFMAAAAVMKGAMANDDAVKFDDGSGTMVSVVDPDHLYYYGNSQGGILGGAYTALSPDVIRGVLGVGGMPYSLLLPRSKDFAPFFDLIRAQMPDHLGQMLFIAGLTQMVWDMGEGAGYAHDMDKQILMQVGLRDLQVTTFGAEIAARAWGMRTVMPQTKPVWGVTEMAPGFKGSAFVEFKYNDLPPTPLDAAPPPAVPGQPSDGDPHECPRRDPSGQLQIDHWLRNDGEVMHYCTGICDDVLQAECR